MGIEHEFIVLGFFLLCSSLSAILGYKLAELRYCNKEAENE